MENPDPSEKVGQGGPAKPQQSGGQSDADKDRQRDSQGGDKESARPSPSGVPNEG